MTGDGTQVAPPPNLILIIADDQGFTDFGFMGHPTVKTPQLDRLAAQSAVFPQGYVPTSLCRPSLATLLTGLYPHQHQICFNDPPRGTDRRLAERFIRAAPTLPRLLAAAGYQSFQTGKFWEGNFANAGFTAGMTHGDPERKGRHGDEGLAIGRQTMQPIEAFLDRVGSHPFFLWYAPMMPHEPHNPPAKYRSLYQDKGLPARLAAYYGMCSWFDATVGELRALLEKKAKQANTLIVFLVDNGWITDITHRQGFAPRSKRSPFEMGIRTPILLYWPQRIKPRIDPTLVSSIDIVPTLLAAAQLGNEATRLPGKDLLPVAEGKESLARKAVFGATFAHDATELGQPARDVEYRWVRRGDWKLILPSKAPEAPMLYNLRVDPRETANLLLRGGQPEASQLRQLLDAWWEGR